MTWIKCSERLPDKVGEILVKIEGKTFLGFALQSSSLPRYIPLDMVYCEFPYQFKDEDIFIGGGNFKWYPEHFKEPTHWMYIPEVKYDVD